MTSHEILKAHPLDILFDNRNKQYGAYTLRKYYNNRLCLSLFISFGSLFILLLLIKPGREHAVFMQGGRGVVITTIIPPDKVQFKKPEVQRTSRPRQQQAATEKLTRLNIVKQTSQVVSEQNQFKEALVGTTSIKGHIPLTIDPPALPHVASTGNQTASATPAETMPLQKEAEFPGGMSSWIRFLQNNLRVPADLQAGEQKTVLMRFEVATDGTVTGFEILQSAGREYDAEVIRVLKKMPKWKPAIQNGSPTASRYTQPVTFVGLEY